MGFTKKIFSYQIFIRFIDLETEKYGDREEQRSSLNPKRNLS